MPGGPYKIDQHEVPRVTSSKRIEGKVKKLMSWAMHFIENATHLARKETRFVRKANTDLKGQLSEGKSVY